ncbi:MAG: hypothetical protein WD801_16465 [Gemmatimonadaceae bacterium]
MIRYLTEDGDHDRDIKHLIWERESDAGVVHTVTDVLETSLLEFAPCLGEHLGLEIEQFQSATGNTARELDAEVPGPSA